MDTPKVSRMWAELQKATSRLHDSSILSSCESEIQELMRQVDLMVDARKQEWLREKRSLQSKVDVREQELVIQKATLSQKLLEIGQLRMSLDNMEQSQREVRVKYETDLANLKEQVGQMKREYDKLQRRYLKHNRDKHRDSADESEAKQLSLELEEYRKRSVEWERERKHFQQQIESLKSQNQILADKCDLVAQTSTDLRSQLERRREILSDAEQGLKSQVTQLSGMLDRAKDTIASQDSQLSRLKTALDDSCSSHRRALQEKELIECELRDTQQRIRKLEDEAIELRISNDAQGKLIASMEADQTKTSRHLVQLQLEVQDKENLIKSQKSPCENSVQLNKIQSALSRAKSDIKLFQQTEHQLKADVNRLQSELRSVIGERGSLKSELARMDVKQSSPDNSNLLNQLNSDYTKLQQELSSVKQVYDSERSKWRQLEEELKRDLASHVSEINERKRKISELQELNNTQTKTLDALYIELEVRTTQLNASRHENRHLRQVSSLIPVTGKFEEMQSTYEQLVATLERRNRSLGDDVAKLETELQSCQGTQFQTKIAELEKELNEKETKLRNLSRANDAMNSFVNGVDQIVQSSPRHKSTVTSAKSSSRSIRSSTLDGDADLLLAVQDDRARELEDILSQHISDLRTMTDATLCKYVVTNKLQQPLQ